MRFFLFIVLATSLSLSLAKADPFTLEKPGRASAMSSKTDKPLAAKRSSAASACAAYGPGFVKVDGSDTCVKVGGAISVGVSGGR